MMDCSLKIPVEYSGLYQYDIDQGENEIKIIYQNFPQKFDSKKVQLKLTDDKAAISLRINPKLPPLFEGSLQHPISSAELIHEEGKMTLVLKKVEPVEWNVVLILKEHPETKIVDPMSAYTFSILLFSQNDPDAQQVGAQLLAQVTDQGLPPAMMEFSMISLAAGTTAIHGIRMLRTLSDEYHYLPACYHLSLKLLENAKTTTEGMKYLKMAVDGSFPPALLSYGLALSPFSKMHPEVKKNAKLAAENLEAFIAQEPDGDSKAAALHELALIYFNGSEDFVANKEKAETLQQSAKKINSEVEDLPK